MDFKTTLTPKINGKQNPGEFYANNYLKHVPYSYGYKLECVDDKFSKHFKSYLSEDAA